MHFLVKYYRTFSNCNKWLRDWRADIRFVFIVLRRTRFVCSRVIGAKIVSTDANAAKLTPRTPRSPKARMTSNVFVVVSSFLSSELTMVVIGLFFSSKLMRNMRETLGSLLSLSLSLSLSRNLSRGRREVSPHVAGASEICDMPVCIPQARPLYDHFPSQEPLAALLLCLCCLRKLRSRYR